jgi:excisionase family DNA binding protein
MDLSQQLTPEQFAWVMQRDVRTVYQWLREKKISHFKDGRTTRISPEAATDFILSQTIQAHREPAPRLGSEDAELLWGRIERLIQTVLAARERIERKEAA